MNCALSTAFTRLPTAARRQYAPRAMSNHVKFTIHGEPASKSNSRQIVMIGKGESRRPAVIKSPKALQYAKDFQKQLPKAARVMFCGPVRVTMTIYYANERSDLDEQAILDCMQPRFLKLESGKRVKVWDGVYLNDRQIVERHTYKRIDKSNPRAEIEVVALEPQALELTLNEVYDDPLQ